MRSAAPRRLRRAHAIVAASLLPWSPLAACDSAAGSERSPSEAGAALDAATPSDAAAPNGDDSGELVVLPPTRIGALVGPFYTPAPGQDELPFFGTDLGVSFRYGDEERVLFGDTWIDERGTLLGATHDDCQGSISLDATTGFADGDAVDRFVDGLAGSAEQPAWRRAAPTLRLEETAGGQIAPIELYRGGVAEGALVDLGVGKAVVAAFSDQRGGAFAIFRRDVAVECTGAEDGAEPRCDEGFVCDRELGFCAGSTGEYRRTCVLGTDRCACEVGAGSGLCQDRTSSMYGVGDEDGRLESVVIEHELGNADPELPTRYATVPWRTNKLTNPIARVVADFDPDRDDPDDNDYTQATGLSPEREKVLIWGRPHSVGTKAVGRDARLYFAWSDVPESSAQGPIGWHPRYLSGLEDGRPSFSSNPADAIALDLGGDPLPESERYDIVDRTAITYVASLQRWVMFYGGDFSAAVLQQFVGPNYGLVERAPTGAIHARFARHPWGPWSAPQPVLEAGDPSLDVPAAGSEYAAGGILHHSRCVGPDCAPGAPAALFLLAPDGFFYAPNIFDAFTEPRDGGNAVDLYWNVSTWNPYQVMFLRTRIVRSE